ncbi:amidohydrolase [Sphingomonas abietis]|uniref:Amidohydrolase n=1 Tax=Sphingomonas abietis TaxID=3012344 RepID=A0ABY7NSM7_9SPHN|nr:amidohydrolase [Sphingomonas abietis]WBO24566.1 amidohydrolase [Sphingomonas abietis]
MAKKPPKYAPAPPTEGGLLDDVNGYTIDRDGSVKRFNGLLIGKDGKVKALLQPGDKRPEWLDFRLDGHGRTMLPGLIDAHGHVMELGFALTHVDLVGTTSLADAQTRLANYAAKHPNPAWIQGGGWNQEIWKLGRFPTAADIDLAVRERPVVLERVDGHALVANSAAMAAAGISAATKDVPGGHIERDAKGKPTGVFVDAARDLILRAVPQPAPIERDDAFRAAQQALLSYGITATCDMGTTLDDWNVLRRAGDANAIRVRIVSYGMGVDTTLSVAGNGPTPWLYDGHLRMVGVKLFADGALGSRGAWLKKPYADMPSTRGTSLLDDTKLKNLMSRAAMDNFQVAVHAIGDAANDEVLSSIEELAQTYKGDRRWRIEHAQIVDPADLPRFAHNGIIASMQPTHETSDWQMAEKRLGADRLKGDYAWATMAAEHVPLAFGSDYPVESPNPFPGLAAAVSREDAQGQPAGGWQPQEKITMPQALAAFTSGAAFAAQAEDRIGSLEPGHMADFVLVDTDPLTTQDAQAVRHTQVLETWIGGTRVWVKK